MGNWARTLTGLEKEMAGDKTNARLIRIPKIHALLSMIFPPYKDGKFNPFNFFLPTN
jgi:hypothetical protein